MTDRLDRPTLLAYALPGLPAAMVGLPLYIYLPSYYAVDLGLGLGVVGLVLLAARLWDERKLAYPINGHKKGVYWLTYFKMPGGNLTTLERQCEITDDIIRKLVLKVDDRIADALVQHALSGEAAPKRSSPPVAPTVS